MKYIGRIPQMSKRENVPSCFQHIEAAIGQDDEPAGFELRLLESLLQDKFMVLTGNS